MSSITEGSVTKTTTNMRKCKLTWTCNVCTFENTNRVKNCQICNVSKNSKKIINTHNNNQLIQKRKRRRRKKTHDNNGKKSKTLKTTTKRSNDKVVDKLKNNMDKSKSKKKNNNNNEKNKKTRTNTTFTKLEKLIYKELKNIRQSEFILESYRNYKSKSRKEQNSAMNSPEVLAAIQGKENALLQIRHWLIKCASFYSDHVKLKNFKDDGISEEDIFCAKCLKVSIEPNNDLLLCDGPCQRAYHQLCDERKIKTEDIPPGDNDWFCLQCEVILETFDHLGEILFDGDKRHYKLYSFDDIYTLLVPELAIFQTSKDFHNKKNLIGLKVLKRSNKNRHGTSKFLNQSICKIVNYNESSDIFQLEICDIDDDNNNNFNNNNNKMNDNGSSSSSNCSVTTSTTTTTTMTTKNNDFNTIALNSEELSLYCKRVIVKNNSNINVNNVDNSNAGTSFLNMNFSENDSDDDDYEVTKTNLSNDDSDDSSSSNSSSSDDSESDVEEDDDTKQERKNEKTPFVVGGKSLRRRRVKVDYKKLAGEIGEDDDWGDSLLDEEYDPSNKIQNEEDEIAAAIKLSLKEQ